MALKKGPPAAAPTRHHEPERPVACVFVDPSVTPRDLRDLFVYLEDRLYGEVCDHTYAHTAAFLVARHISASAALPWLRLLGGGCDCEILDHVEQYWLQ